MNSTARETEVIELLSLRRVAENLRVFRFSRPANYSFMPGQFAVLGVDDSGKPLERAYSIASAPTETFLEFFIELVPTGRLTPRLFALLEGAKVTLRPAARGRFLLDPKAARHLMVATVTGVAPFVSMLRAGAAGAVLIHGASRSAELGYAEELSTRMGLDYLPTVSRPSEDAAWSGATGRAETHLLRVIEQRGLLPARTTAYLCGHPGMVANARAILTRQGWRPELIRTESW